MLFYLSLLLLLYSGISKGFFSPPLEDIHLDTSLPLISCISVSSDEKIILGMGRLCAIEEQKLETGLKQTRWAHIEGLNWYLDIIQQLECEGFTSFTPIGYGHCKALPFQNNVQTSKICICSTSLCNSNMSNCEKSVESSMASSSSPKPLPIHIPNLTYPLACADMQTSKLGLNYFECLRMSKSRLGVSLSACNNYFYLRTVMCSSIYINHLNLALNQALSIFEAAYELDIHLFQAVNHKSLHSYKQVFQTATQVLIVVKNGADIRCYCYCITANCNVDISTCTNKLNFDCIGSISSTSKCSDKL